MSWPYTYCKLPHRVPRVDLDVIQSILDSTILVSSYANPVSISCSFSMFFPFASPALATT